MPDDPRLTTGTLGTAVSLRLVPPLKPGLGVGLVAAIGLTQLLRGFLYRVSPVDPLAFVAGLVVVVIAVLVASIRPAGRAARVDPMVSMRTEG